MILILIVLGYNGYLGYELFTQSSLGILDFMLGWILLFFIAAKIHEWYYKKYIWSKVFATKCELCYKAGRFHFAGEKISNEYPCYEARYRTNPNLYSCKQEYDLLHGSGYFNRT